MLYNTNKLVENDEFKLQFDGVCKGRKSGFEQEEVGVCEDDERHVEQDAGELNQDKQASTFLRMSVVALFDHFPCCIDVGGGDDGLLNCEAHDLHLLHSRVP